MSDREALAAAREALPEFRQQDDYLLSPGASLMSEESHEIIHLDTLRRALAAARLAASAPAPLTERQIAEAMLAVDDPLAWGRLGEGQGDMVRKFARAIESAVRASALPQEPRAWAVVDKNGGVQELLHSRPTDAQLTYWDRDSGWEKLAPHRRVALGPVAAPSAPATPPEQAAAWRCFHCNECFTDAEAAREHFGASEYQQPACHIDIAEYRRMEEANRRHCEEDTDLHREIYRLQAEHSTALMREEEKGYARGLRDGRYLVATPPAQPEQAIAALRAILAEPYGCPFCDSGKLRNPAKDHTEECGFALARAALASTPPVPAEPVAYRQWSTKWHDWEYQTSRGDLRADYPAEPLYTTPSRLAGSMRG